MNKFIVLSTQRSGSAFLVTSLASHPKIECHREIFLKRNEHSDSYTSYRNASVKRRLLHYINRRALVSSYLERVYNDNIEGVDTSGFKFMYSQARFFPEAVAWLQKNNVSVIHLIRENFLRTIVSRGIAQARGVHHSDKELEKLQISLQPEATLREMNKMLADVDQHRTLFPNNPYMEVNYESFAENRDRESKRLLDFLGVRSNHSLSSKLVKINPHPLNELIENYTEIADSLSGTVFENFLDQ
jgi:LPS sulfotransferase NodH